MKKPLIAILALAAVAACNKAEVIDSNPGEAIQFGDAFVDNATKAEDLTYGVVALKKFNVYGTVQGTGNGVVNIFDGAEVTGTVGANVWSCDVKQYWIADAIYNFAAVADATVATKDANNMPLTLTPIADAKSNFKDMLYDAPNAITGQASGNGKVNFTFSHLLSPSLHHVMLNTKQ